MVPSYWGFMLEHRALEALNEGLMEKADTPVVIAINQISDMVVIAIGNFLST